VDYTFFTECLEAVMNKAIVAACMGLLVVAGCSKDKKPASSDMTPPPPPSVISTTPEPITMAPAPANPIMPPTPVAPMEAAHTKAPAPKAGHVTHVAREESAVGKKVYVVRKGDSLGKIAKHYKTTVAKLLKANPKIKPNKILVGQKINIP
jgi:nucleoid-associated protein YgaU